MDGREGVAPPPFFYFILFFSTKRFTEGEKTVFHSSMSMLVSFFIFPLARVCINVVSKDREE
jgi:hypothetical protein